MNEDIVHKDSLDSALILKKMKTVFLGRNLRIEPVLDSTNEELFRNLERDPTLPHGSTIFARQQTQGRGRQGNSWYSASPEGLYLSFLLRPKLLPEDFVWITLTLGLGVAKTLEEFSFSPRIKWPNDILCSGKKVSGILMESRNLNPEHPVFVAGIGINLNQDHFPEALGQPVTSLKQLRQKPIPPNEFCCVLLEQLEKTLIQLEQKDKKTLLQEISNRALSLQKRVCLRFKGNDYHGTMEGFSEKLGILLRLEEGSLQEFPGEITTLRESES